ncbi:MULTISPECIES: VIT1/CCC1 transporter family protein [unclassified Corynebacterium]|uniref:VIT1/CCC1 transporter family protein n=1 Tax=unclassified Corynebacterium TaxID=2624378 RepID=UPI0029CA3B26|nr:MULTISPECIES: VIT1/CCC1 transporter family protein [unclassified Corynebacterium]WPF65540.1 VIT1/CCC1 transporter family protein [Corynebacterium sp. 22KM0430]WPF68035.1 VIT1/CCC1 transporter family protein [Corynebacterium sp. 21KM1197]
MNTSPPPTRKQIQRWRQYLADERAEAAVYRELARKKTREEREILLKLAEAESRHEEYWREKLGDEVGMPQRPGLKTRFIGWLARRFGSVFVLAMMQSAEARNPYSSDDDAPGQIAADEHVHSEVVKGLAARSRERMSGDFRAAIFGANDGLVSNLALVIGVMGSGVSSSMILITGVSGLLAGALSMAVGEYISVKSQAELLEASTPQEDTATLLPELDVNANELALVFRARGYSEEEAEERAREAFSQAHAAASEAAAGESEAEDVKDGAWSAAMSSFLCFAAGALIPVLPFLFGASALVGGVVAIALVSVALLCTGAFTGILSGKPPVPRALRQWLVGMGATAVTYVLGVLFGQVIG